MKTSTSFWLLDSTQIHRQCRKNIASWLHVTQSRATGHGCLQLYLTTSATGCMSCRLQLVAYMYISTMRPSRRKSIRDWGAHFASHMHVDAVPPLIFWIHNHAFSAKAKRQQNITSQRQWLEQAFPARRRRTVWFVTTASALMVWRCCLGTTH